VTFPATVVRVFIASPSDTADERSTARTVIASWNASHAEGEGVVLVPVGWETDAVPEWGDEPQSILNRQLVDSSDVLIGVFWVRLGTRTASGRSGTVEEIERFAASGKPVLLYFCRKSPDLDLIDTDQLKAVRDFEAECQGRALYDTYGDGAEYEAKLARALTHVVRDRFTGGSASAGGLPRGQRLASPPSVKKQPRLAAHLENLGQSSHRLIVANTGTVDVLKVDVEVPPEATSFSLFRTDFPLDILRPGERVGVPAALHMGGGKSIFDVWLVGETAEGEQIRFPAKVSI
jgi:hypothetical protein